MADFSEKPLEGPFQEGQGRECIMKFKSDLVGMLHVYDGHCIFFGGGKEIDLTGLQTNKLFSNEVTFSLSLNKDTFRCYYFWLQNICICCYENVMKK